MLDLLKHRRSTRVFQEKDVEQEKIDVILKSALLSPSSRSRRPWEFIAVTEQELLEKLAMCREHSSQLLAKAPLGIVIIADPTKCDVWIEDCSITAIIMQLTVELLGLGSCWIQVRERFHRDNIKAEDYIKDLLGVPEKYHVECIVAIGYKGEEKEPHNEADLPFDKIHFNKYN